MLPTKPLGRAALVNGTCSDNAQRKSAVRNGEGPPPVTPVPKYKARNVSAVRDFPPGCGRVAPRMNFSLGPETDTAISNGNEGGGGATGLSEDLQEVVAATLRDDAIPFLLDGNIFLQSRESDTVTNANGTEKRVRKYPPRRKFSAVRDFPPNCGRNAPSLGDVELVKVVCVSPKDKSSIPEKSNHRMDDKTPTENTSIDEGNREDVVLGGDSSKRLETMGLEVTRKAIDSALGMNGKTSIENTSIDDGHMEVEVLGGDSSKRLETRGSKVTRKVVDSALGMNGKIRKEMEIDAKKSVEDVQDGGLKKINLENSVSKVAKDVVQSKKLVDSSKDKTRTREALASIEDERTKADLKHIGGDSQPEESLDMVTLRKGKSKLEGSDSKVQVNKAQPETESIDVNDESERKADEEQEVKHGDPSFEDKLVWWDHEFGTRDDGDDGYDDDGDGYVDVDDVEGFEEDPGKQMVVYSRVIDEKEKQSDAPGYHDQTREVNLESIERVSDAVVVCDGASVRKQKKIETTSPPVIGQKTKMTARKKVGGNSSKEKPFKAYKKTAGQQSGKPLDWDWVEDKSHSEDRALVPVSRPVDVYVSPLGPGPSSSADQDFDSPRRRVMEALRIYRDECRKIAQEEKSKPKDKKKNGGPIRIDLEAAKKLKERNQYVNGKDHIVGSVPGVEVGDEYLYRTELNVIGLHRQIQGGIDFLKIDKGTTIATSIVSSGGYADDLGNADVLTYTGQGGQAVKGKQPEDQKLERGNLGLKNSLDEKNPVRVTRLKQDGKTKKYVYDGLYLVKKYWQDMGPTGKLVYQFRLERIPGQPVIGHKEAKQTKRLKGREGVCVDDISQGNEVIPICAVNTINDEKPPPFNYITKMVYPDWYNPIPMEGCDCTTRCSDSGKCLCAVKNGGEIPFNQDGDIINAKALVYECGPHCRCSSSCHNRPSQRGIKFQLELFKTEKRGWGVRSLNAIPLGSFICEYLGELLKEKDADLRMGNDEYLFDIGNNYLDNTQKDGDENQSSEVNESFTIDAVEYGNVGRFINHSCTPNLYAQNVLYDNYDKRIPRIMLFATENIPPLQELTYHYNYSVDQVRDANGNIKKKYCYCGSHECTGRLY